MIHGFVKGALQYLSHSTFGGVLNLSDIILTDSGDCKVWDILHEKHPPG